MPPIGVEGTTGPPDGLTIRPRRREDDERLLEIYHQWETVFLMSLAAWRYEMDERVRPEGEEPVQLVAELDGVPAGDAYFAMYNSDERAYFSIVEVDEARRGQGIGTALWKAAARELVARDAARTYVQIADDNEPGRRFAVSVGFHECGRSERISRLPVAEANVEGFEGVEDRLAADGITIGTVAGMDTSDERLMHALFDAIMAAQHDVPRSEPFVPPRYEIWRSNFMKHPATAPETYWVAFHDGIPIGVANLPRKSDTHSENGFTGVRPEFRGRGVARALKLRTVQWAKANGIDYIDTGNDAENARMLSINISLGYRPLPVRVEWVREF